MKITIIHGENTFASRQAYIALVQKAKAKGWMIQKLDGSQNIVEQMSTPSLFGEKIVYVLDNLGKTSAKDFSWLSEGQAAQNEFLLIYSPVSLGDKVIRGLPNEVKVEEYKYPKKIFQLLDAFTPKNTTTFLGLLSEVLEQQPIELVFALLAKHLRDLFWVGLASDQPPYPAWRISKLRSQSNQFAPEKIAETIKLLAEIDLKVKTSDTSLGDLLDLVVIRQLE